MRRSILRYLQDEPSEGWITPSALVTRAGLVVAGAALLYATGGFGARGTDSDDAFIVFAAFFLYAYAFGLLILAAVRTHFRYSNLLILGAVLLILLSVYFIAFVKSPRVYPSDVMAYTAYSAQMVLDGENPYSVHDQEIAKEAGQGAGLTHDAKGEVIDRIMVYPAGHLLPYSAALALGLHDLRWLIAISVLAIVIVLWLAAPPLLRPLAALPILVSPETAVSHPFVGVSDATWLFPMLCAVIALNAGRYNLAALAYGCAVATKLQPGLLAPFLLIWLWNESKAMQPTERLTFVGKFFAIAGGVFVLINLPFMIWQFKDWFTGITFNFTANLELNGSGLSNLTRGGVINLGKDFYSAATMAVLVLLVAVYFRFYGNLKHAIWIMPGIVFWFAHRSLTSYFVYWVPLLLIGIFAMWREQQASAAADQEFERADVAIS